MRAIICVVDVVFCHPRWGGGQKKTFTGFITINEIRQKIKGNADLLFLDIAREGLFSFKVSGKEWDATDEKFLE